MSAGTGNRCGHDPQNPQWFTPPAKNRARPPILRKLNEAIQAYYHEPAATIPSLNLANGSERQQRSERREACLLVLSSLTHYLDLVTLRVGIPQTDGSFQGITMEYLAEVAGIGLRRAERAVADLVAAGIVTVHPICEKIGDAIYKGSAAIRTVSRSLFKLFGLGGRLRYERERASARRRKQERKATAKGQAKIDLAVRGAAGRRPKPQPEPKKERENRTIKLKKLMEQFPDKTVEELVELLRAQEPP